jgi:hypothetical protein
VSIFFNGKISPNFDLKSHPSTSKARTKVKNNLRSQKHYTLEHMIHLHFPLNLDKNHHMWQVTRILKTRWVHPTIQYELLLPIVVVLHQKCNEHYIPITTCWRSQDNPLTKVTANYGGPKCNTWKNRPSSFPSYFFEFWMDQSSINKIIIHQFQAIFFHLALTQLKDNYVVLVCTNTI